MDAEEDENAKVVKIWLWTQMNTYVDFLGSLLKDDEVFLRVRSSIPIVCYIVIAKSCKQDVLAPNTSLSTKTSLHCFSKLARYALQENSKLPSISAAIRAFSFLDKCVRKRRRRRPVESRCACPLL